MKKTETLFNLISPQLDRIREQSEEYLKKVLKKEKGQEINLYSEDGEPILKENGFGTFVSVPYDGGNHPEYASNLYSTVERVFLRGGEVFLDVEDSTGYPLENVDWAGVYDVAMYIYKAKKTTKKC